MHKTVALLLLVSFTLSCKSSFRSNFRNFNAYYNTYYNAKKSFQEGEKSSNAQIRKYNTLRPIRIYQTPLGAGEGSFQNAIDKGADILRKHENSKWVDNALEIIGKSYFYRKEYFSADQKFDELYLTTKNIELKQRAVFWKGRVLLELEATNQGVQYLIDEMALFEGQWKSNLRYQIQTILAEHYIARENWVSALDLLNASVNKLPKKKYKERGYFLIGQVNEILGNSEEAYIAYDRVSKFYREYDLQFEAQKKKAEVARALGRYDDAYKVFSSMVRDDKNTEFIAELNFELGKTEQYRGNFEKASSIYKRILQDKRSKIGTVTKAKTYNGLAEIYRFEFNDFKQVAAYYDSAASINAPVDELPEEFNASEYAKSFGKYASLKNEIYLQDSLLWLGTLPQDQFDSVLVELERKKREELKRLQKQQEDRRNTLINVNPDVNQVTEQENTSTSGFLNYKNPALLAETSLQFNAIWQGRPLVDNWRVSQLIVNQSPEQDLSAEERGNNSGTEQTELLVAIDLSPIPFTPQAQDSVRTLLAELNYELANLFFLSLDLPDSAQFYFEKVLRESLDSKVASVSLYSLSEVSASKGEVDKAQIRGEELLRKFPNTIYADRLIEKYDLPAPDNVQVISEPNPVEQYLSLMADEYSADTVTASNLKNFETVNRSTKVGERALFDAIELYAKLGTEQAGFEDKMRTWDTTKTNWKQIQIQFKKEKDSALVALADTSLSISIADSSYFASFQDSVLNEPDFNEVFPYRGAFWDSTRSTIQVFFANYSSSALRSRVEVLNKEFELPKEIVIEVSDSTVSDTMISDSTVSDSLDAAIGDYLNCDEINQEILIRNGYENFVTLVKIPQSANEREISFLFFFNERGIIQEFKLSSQTANQELIDAFVDAIEEHLSFEPVLYNGQASPISCEIIFEI